MKRGQMVEVFIEDSKYPSIGIGYVDGKKIEIKNALPGERVIAAVRKNKEEKAEGKLKKVLEHPSDTVKPLCPHTNDCGGCISQHVPYDKQLMRKEKEVLKLFKEAGIEDFIYDGIEKSPMEFGYRNKMEFTFGNMEKGGDLTLGMHQSGKFYNIIPIEKCMIADNDYNLLLKAVWEYCKSKDLPFYKKMNHEGYLRYLIIRKSFRRNELLANIVTTTQMEHDFSDLAAQLLKLNLNNTLVGFLHTKNDSLSDAVVNQGYEVIYGRDYIIEEILGLKFKISAFSFFQTNSLGAEKLYSVVQEYLGGSDGKVIYDLYCGTGTITQIASQKAEKVYGIELVEEAIEAAKENAKLNDINNIEFIVGDVGQKLREIDKKPDMIIIDPPRPGVEPKALKQIINYGVSQIIYVSCNPKTLVPNLQEMMEAGYKVDKMKLVDMFPHTPHVESVVLMSRVEK